MSDNIPLDVQIEIIKRAPDVKTLIRFRAVSKPWVSFIDSSEFISGFRARKTQPPTLLLSCRNKGPRKYLSVNNDTFTQQQDLSPNVSFLVKQLDATRVNTDTFTRQQDLDVSLKQLTDGTHVIGYSRGLMCLYASDDKEGMLVLWNPSIRRCVGILGPGEGSHLHFDTCVGILGQGEGSHLVFGFAVCPVTNEPTIVKISFPWKVLIFTLSSKKWTEIECRDPGKSFRLIEGSCFVIGSCIYRIGTEDDVASRYLILSFDLIAKEFRAIDLPDDMIGDNYSSPGNLFISKLKGSLYVIVPLEELKVWKMEPDCSFTLQFTINITSDSYLQVTKIVGFRKNGELLLETVNRQPEFFGEVRESALENYDPCSQHLSNLGFSGDNRSFFVSPYKETLHLLDHPDSCVYPGIN